jgi:hypothetical protein
MGFNKHIRNSKNKNTQKEHKQITKIFENLFFNYMTPLLAMASNLFPLASFINNIKRCGGEVNTARFGFGKLSLQK